VGADREPLAARVAALDWWHTLELVTPGSWDLRQTDARRAALEWFVFNRAGLRKAVTLAGFAVEAMTPILRDHAGPAITRGSLPRTVAALGILGRSVALRARAPRA
jgi:hypothetical protein